MYFATGYLFGLIGMAGLAAHFDAVFLDKSAHYNLRDGARAAGKPVHSFKHLSASDLARALRREVRGGVRPLVATDGMFSTFGSVPPLAEYARLLAPLGGWLLVDESHSFSALGPTGRGAAEHHAVSGERVLIGGSLGKGLGAYGGLAVGAAGVIAELWQSPPARGAASGMSCGAAMAAASMRLLRQQPERLVKLRRNTLQLKTGIRTLGIDANDTEAPVAALVSGTAAEMQAVQQSLMAEGIYVIYATYVGAGPHGALRYAAFADHDPADIDRLIGALRSRL